MSRDQRLQLEYESRTRPTARKIRRNTLETITELIIVIAIFACMISVLLPERHTRRRGSPSLGSASNLRQIFQALRNYADGNRDCLPPSFADLMEKQLGISNSVVFVRAMGDATPSRGTTLEQIRADLQDPINRHCSYVFVVPSRSFKEFYPETVIAYERLDGHADKVIQVAYADGSVRPLTRAEATKLVAKLQAGGNPLKQKAPVQGASSKPTTAKS